MIRGIARFLYKNSIRKISSIAMVQPSNTQLLHRDQDTSLELVFSDGNNEDWKSFLNVCITAYQNDVVYKQMYPNDKKRHEFLKYYFEHYYRFAYKNGLGKLAYIQAEDLVRNNTSMVGGLTVVNACDYSEGEDPRMKWIDMEGWNKYIRRKRWLNDKVFRRFQNISYTLGRKLVYISSAVLLDQYRSMLPFGNWASHCSEQFIEYSYGKDWKDRTLPFFITDYSFLALHLTRHSSKIVQVYYCNVGNFFGNKTERGTKKDSLIWALVFGVDDDDTIKYITEQTRDNDSVDVTNTWSFKDQLVR
ncbi:uncharacterized protein LOC120337648 [Styela clava]